MRTARQRSQFQFCSMLATSLLTLHAVWGIPATNRPCNQAYLKEFTQLFREAVKGAENRGDCSARALQKVFLLGHTCDLAFVAATRLMNAVNRWARLRLSKGLRVPGLRSAVPPLLLLTLGSWLSIWNWQTVGRGKWQGPSGQFDDRQPKEAGSKAMHNLRTEWKNMRRLDAERGRNNRLELNASVVDKLRQVASLCCADGVAVMCGGVWSPALERFGAQVGEIHQQCPYCHDNVVPDLDHIYWICDAFSHCRCIVPPIRPLARRLSWNGELNNKECLRLVS